MAALLLKLIATKTGAYGANRWQPVNKWINTEIRGWIRNFAVDCSEKHSVGFDQAAAQAEIILVEDSPLARRYVAHGRAKAHLDPVAGEG